MLGVILVWAKTVGAAQGEAGLSVDASDLGLTANMKCFVHIETVHCPILGSEICI
jgi:hypothetical protein